MWKVVPCQVASMVSPAPRRVVRCASVVAAECWLLRESISRPGLDALKNAIPKKPRGGDNHHDRFAGSPEEDVQREEDWDQKHVVRNEQKIQVEEANELVPLKQREPVSRRALQR